MSEPKPPCPRQCDESLREIVETRKNGAKSDTGQYADVVVKRCSLCGRNHYEINVDPVRLGTVGHEGDLV